ncbi:MAG: PD40 domain-containing protein [Bacteroidales bacterium]|nr:PD40 domain-containing protein [Bacteroidales bacterium]
MIKIPLMPGFPGYLRITSLMILLFLVLSGSPSLMAQDSCFVELDKKDAKLFETGTTDFKRGNYVLAAQTMRDLLTRNPDFADALFILGTSYIKRQDSDFRQAEEYFMKVLEICPDYDLYIHYYLGEIAYSKEDFSATVTHLTAFLKDVDKIKNDEDYNRAVSLLDYSGFYKEMITNPVPFRPEVVEGISSPENEYLAILSPDNQIAMFTREKKILPDRNSLLQTSGYKEKFMYSIRDYDGSFTHGEEMPEPFNINDNEGGATLTADNNVLYYTVCQYDKVSHYLNCDIYFSEFRNDEWKEIKSAGGRINKPGSWESQPSISADGTILFFVSDRPGGYGGYDIYKATRSHGGEWGAPVNMGPLINSSGNEKSPFIHPDGKTLYFSSDGWMGMGGYDVFYVRLQEDGSLKKPLNIGYPINSPEDEVGFFVSTDGTRGFFASNKLKEQGGWDLYTFDLYDKARPDKVLFIKGTVKDENSFEPLKARIELRNVETKKVSEVSLDSNTGKYVAVAPFDNDYIMTIKKEGYVYESKYISRVDSVFKAPVTVDMEIQPIELEKSYRINDIYFAFNSFDLTPESKVVLDQLTEFLELNDRLSIQIQGHTDAIGNDAANLILSENRAKSVYDYLIANDVPAGRLTYKGFGETDPLASNDTDEGRAMNRRTCFVITSK